MKVQDLVTPAFLVDADQVSRNIQCMNAHARSCGVSLRPHVKTHKTLQLAQQQLAGWGEDAGVVVSTMAEARMLADAGFSNILYAVPFALQHVDAARAVQRKVRQFHVLLDSVELAQQLHRVSEQDHMTWSVFIKLDTGYHRAGIPVGSDHCTKLLQLLDSSPYITFAGAYSHVGHTYAPGCDLHAIIKQDIEHMARFKADAAALGIAVPVVSVGATPSCTQGMYDHVACGAAAADGQSVVTELHPGNYVFFDRQQVAAGSCTLDEIAVSVATRIIACYPDRHVPSVLVDAGALALSVDSAPQGGYGEVVGHPELEFFKVSQEEGMLRARPGHKIDFTSLSVGMVLRVLPNHACLTAACHPSYAVVRGDDVIDTYTPCRGW